ncbi:hypothetical protein AtNW77_Chr2g0271151 [Arabidopsis thaliana]
MYMNVYITIIRSCSCFLSKFSVIVRRQIKRIREQKTRKIKMNTTNNVFDVSPFLLLEASADSEAGHDSSCSASSCETSCVSQRTSLLGFDLQDDTVNHEERDAGDEEDEDGEGEVNSYIRCGRSQRENLAVDSAAVVSEMDQNRMFWEACLAS